MISLNLESDKPFEDSWTVKLKIDGQDTSASVRDFMNSKVDTMISKPSIATKDMTSKELSAKDTKSVISKNTNVKDPFA